MSTQLNNAAASDQWQVLACPATRRLRVTIANGSVWWQRARSEAIGGGPVWSEEPTILVPQIASYDANCDAVRFKWVVAPASIPALAPAPAARRAFPSRQKLNHTGRAKQTDAQQRDERSPAFAPA